MGFFEWLGIRAQPQHQTQLGSPWATTDQLTRVTWEELFGRPAVLDRAAAMAVPAVAAARHRIVGTLSRLPLAATGRAGSTWNGALSLITQPDEGEPHVSTMQRTLDDILFDGRAWWAVVTSYSELSSTVAFPRSIVQLPTAHVGPDGRPSEAWLQWLVRARGLRVLQHPQRDGQPWLIYFDGPHAGLLSQAATSIGSAAAMERAAGNAAKNPVPSVELHQTGGIDLTGPEITALTSQWARARNGENGGVAYTNASIETRTHGQHDAQLLVDGRNQSAVDIARHAGIPASSIDAGIPGASITYANLTDRVTDLVNMGLQPYAAAITSRLSMNDVLPQGVTVRFDYTELYPATPSEPSSTPVDSTRDRSNAS